MVGGIIISVTFFAAVFGILYVWLITRHKERLALIDKGMDAGIFSPREHRSHPRMLLITGLFFAGVAIGLLVGALLVSETVLSEGVCYSSMIILFAGISLIAGYYIDRKKINNHTPDQP